MKKRILSVFVILSFLSFFIWDDYSFGKEAEPTELNGQEAEDIAEGFMIENNGSLDDGLEKEIIPLYDAEDEISAYMITFDKKNRQQGYAVIDAKESRGAVIEYCYGEDNFIEEAKDELCDSKKQKKNAKIYYLGGLTYVLKTKNSKKDDVYTDISTGDTQASTEDGIVEGDKILGSGKDSEGKIISRPKDYIPGEILSSQVYDVPGSTKISNQGTKIHRQYFQMDEFSTGTVCTPVAITNLFYHWSRYDSNRFSALRRGSWQDTYERMASLCNTSTTTGTSLSNVDSAIEWHCTSQNIRCRSRTYSGTNGGAKIVAELKNRRPCILHVFKHKKYKDHSMLALGYETYKYKKGNSNKTDIYIRVADGWTKSSSRYVWGGCNGSWDYTSVVFSTK